MVGYESQKVTAGDRRTLTIVMVKNQQALDQVVVVGYGTQKKVNLTGAVSQVDAKTIADKPISNVAQALQGAFLTSI